MEFLILDLLWDSEINFPEIVPVKFNVKLRDILIVISEGFGQGFYFCPKYFQFLTKLCVNDLCDF